MKSIAPDWEQMTFDRVPARRIPSSLRLERQPGILSSRFQFAEIRLGDKLLWDESSDSFRRYAAPGGAAFSRPAGFWISFDSLSPLDTAPGKSTLMVLYPHSVSVETAEARSAA